MFPSQGVSSRMEDRVLLLKDLSYQPVREENVSTATNISIRGSPSHTDTETDVFERDKYKLNLYIPKTQPSGTSAGESSRKPPIVVFVHGGGWRRGDRSAWKHYISVLDTNFFVAFILRLCKLYGNIGEALAERGVACAVISYPLCKLEMPWLLFEMFTSYLMSSLFLLTIVWTSVFCWNTVSSLLGFSLHIVFKIIQFSDVVQVALLSLTLVNVTYVFIMTTLKDRYKLNTTNISCMWGLTTLALLLFHTHGDTTMTATRPSSNFAIFLVTLVTTQGMLLFKRLQTKSFSYKEQLKAVVESARFVKKLGEDNDLFNSEELYLMGHSAGGHLVTLLALHMFDDPEAHLGIKGVISISGVFDLPKLDKKVLKSLYLHPTFGNQHADWVNASPSHVMPSTNGSGCRQHVTGNSPSKIPQFFLITAERDLHLRADAEALCQKIQTIGGECFLQTICPSNHFTIVWDFKADPANSSTKLTDVCVDFVLGHTTNQ